MLRKLSMLLSLGIFSILLVLGQLQIWMLVIMVSVLLALVFGRFFCGWICPINTFIELGTWIKTKLGIKRRTSKKMENSTWGYALLLFLIAGFILSRATGRNIPLLLFMIPLGVIISITLSPSSWHHWMCPYNVLFKLTGGKSLLGLSVNSSKCTGCAKCQKVCPAESVQITAGKAVIDKTYCLICTACQTACPTKAITYRQSSVTAEEQQAG